MDTPFPHANSSDPPIKPPDILSHIPLPLLALSMFSSTHHAEKPNEDVSQNVTHESELANIANIANIANTANIAKEEKGAEEEEIELMEDDVPEGIVPEQPQSWYERIKTAAFSSTAGIANATAKIKYAFISKDTEEAFLQIWELMNILLKDVPFNKLDLLFGLMMLQEYYKAIPVRSQLTVRDPDLIFNARHYMKYAGACFGPKYIHGMILKSPGALFQGMMGGDQANIETLCAYTGIHPEDVIVSKWTSTSFDPGHYLALDHARGALVLAIRGTFHLKDCLTDLVAHSEAFEEGFVHKGFYLAAKRKLEQLEATILEYLHRHPLYEFVICGHSMGAGIGSIFTLLFNKAHPEVQIKCYAFGCPCILSLELALAPRTSKLITTIVLGDDVVPQLSIESMHKLKAVVIQILSQSNNSVQRAFHWVASNNALSDHTLTKIASILQCIPKPEMLPRVQSTSIASDSLYPPGNIYHILKRVETTTTTTTTTHESHPHSQPTTTSTTTTVITPPTLSPSLGCSADLSSSSSSFSSFSDPFSTITETVKEVTLKVKSPTLPAPSFATLNSSLDNISSPSPSPSPSVSSSSSPPASPKSIPSALSLPTIPPLSLFLTPTKSQPSTPSQSQPVSPRGDTSQATIKTTQEAKEIGYDLERSNPSLFHEIFISHSMFLDHMPHMYEHALRVMAEEYEEVNKVMRDAVG